MASFLPDAILLKMQHASNGKLWVPAKYKNIEYLGPK